MSSFPLVQGTCSRTENIQSGLASTSESEPAEFALNTMSETYHGSFGGGTEGTTITMLSDLMGKMELRFGDSVQLGSGPPRRVITSVVGIRSPICHWREKHSRKRNP